MVKVAVLCGALLALSACTSKSATDTSTDNESKQLQTLRIAAAANLSDVLPKVIDGYQTANKLSKDNIEVTYASSGKL